MNKNNHKPNLFIVGAAKAGTTSVYHYLRQHPEVYVSPIKEPNFFGSEIQWKNLREDHKKNTWINFEKYFSKENLEEKHIAFLDSEENYLKLFKNGKDFKTRAEFSTSYLYSTQAAKEIYDFNPKAKIIIILREPVSRTFSHYFMDVSSNKQNNDDILKVLKEDFYTSKKGYCISNLYLDLSLYSEQINRYLEVFPSEQLLLLRFADLKKNPKNFMKEIFRFINIRETDVEIDFKMKHNQTGLPKNSLVRKVTKLKYIIPKPILSQLKRHKALFYRQSSDEEIPEEAIDFVRTIVSDDWKVSQQLMRQYNEID